MYIENTEELFLEIEDRKEIKEEIKERLDEWIKKEYGIPGFSELVEEHFGISEKTSGVPFRQIPSITVEDTTCYLMCKTLNLTPIAFSYIQESFCTRNPYKISLLKIPWIKWSKKGNLVIKNEKLAHFAKLEKRILKHISIENGKFLPEFHQQLRNKVFRDSYPVVDTSPFLRETLIAAENRPPYVFEEEKGREEKKHIRIADLFRSRPPMDWSYIFFFSLFLDGSRVLLETYENPKGGVPLAKVIFQKTVRKIQENVGISPLVIEIPILTREMLYYNEYLLAGIDSIKLNMTSSDHLPTMFHETAQKVLNFKGVS